MNVNGKPWNSKEYVENLKKRSEETAIKMEQEKEKLKQRILSEWHQYNSIFFWQQCFKYVPLKIIRQTFDNINELAKSNYPVKNRGGLFVSTFKKMGYFPWKEDKSGTEKIHDK